MDNHELLARIKALEEQNAAILRVLWAWRNEQKGLTAKIDAEIKQYVGGGRTKLEELFGESVTYTSMPKT